MLPRANNTVNKFGSGLTTVKQENDSTYTDGISVYISDTTDFLVEQKPSPSIFSQVKEELTETEGVPVVTIHVPANNDNYSNWNDVELKYIAKSSVPADCSAQVGEKEHPVIFLSPNQGKRKNQGASSAPKRVKSTPPQLQPHAEPKIIPVWKREIPKPPGSVSNYVFPHELRANRSRLIIDCPTNIPVLEFKSQLADTRDIVTKMDIAPSSKKKVKELNTNSVSKLFAYPGKTHLSPILRRLYQRHLTSSFTEHEPITDLDLQSLDPNVPVKKSRSSSNTLRNVIVDSVSNDANTELSPVKEGEQEHQVLHFLIERGNAGSQEIIVLHDGVESEESMQVILAAAAESGDIETDKNQMFICDGDAADCEYIIVQNDCVEGGGAILPLN